MIKFNKILKFLVCIFGLWYLVFGLRPNFIFAREYYRSDIGLNVHWSLGGFGLDNLYEQRLLESKTNWVREHFQTHSFYSENREGWFARYDAILQKYKNNNINVLGMVAYNESGGRTTPDIDEWRAFLRILVTRYKDYVKYWEIWNEPDSSDYLQPNNPETYAPILSAASSEIKSIDPEAKVVSAGLAYPNPYFAKKLYQLAGDKFDIFAFHAYYCGYYFENGNVDNLEMRLDQVKEIVNKNRPGQEVWITEFGCSQNGGHISEKQQRDYFKYVLPKIYAKNFVNKIFLYNIRDYNYWTTYENGFGITGLNLEPKSAWNWYKNIYVGPYNQLILPAAQEFQKTKELKKKLEKYLGKNNIKNNLPSNFSEQDLFDAYIYGKYPVKALIQAMRFKGKTFHPTISFSQWKEREIYKKYINKDWYGGKIVNKNTYKKIRLTKTQEKQKAKELRIELEKKYKFKKLKIDAKKWPDLLNAYIYGEYPIGAIARTGKYPQVVNSKIPYSRWKNSSIYKFFIKQKVY